MQREHTPTPDSLPVCNDGIPPCGFRARRWARFERDLQEWAETPDGRFSTWRAIQAVRADAPQP